jgi:hypothetical protein
MAVALLAPASRDACLPLDRGAAGTLRVAVAGLGQGASSGGSVTITRTDVPTPPLTVPIPANGTDSVSVPAGTYKVAFSNPVGYIRAPGTVNPQTTQITASQATTASFQVQLVTGFAPADLLDNASFETGWSGFTDWSLSPVPSPVSGLFAITRSQDVAYDGAWSAKSTFGPTTSDKSIHFVYSFGDHLDVYVRVYFYISGTVPDNHHKWLRLRQAGLGGVDGGLYLASTTGGVTWCDVSTVPNANVDLKLGIGIPTVNTWHSIEVEYDRRNWNTPTGPRVRFWYDGSIATGSGPSASAVWGDNNVGSAFWGDDNGKRNSMGPWLYVGAVAAAAHPSAILEIDGTYNGGNTASGAFYYDRIAISTHRIGP